MAFDYNSRTKWEKDRIDRWKREHQKQIDSISGQACPGKKELLEQCRLNTPVMDIKRYMVPEWMEQV